LPTDVPDLDTPPRADAPAVSSVWEQPAPAPVMVVRPPEPQPSAPERTLSPNPLWEIPLSRLSVTRERPIFSSSRRPPPLAAAAVPKPVAPSAKPPQDERPQLTLVGTIGSDAESFGIFVEQATKTGLRLRIGDDFQGWTLRSVQGREVMLERDQRKTILSLPQPSPGAVAAPRDRAESMAAQRAPDLPWSVEPRR
jgi:general secretion pathway protein N